MVGRIQVSKKQVWYKCGTSMVGKRTGVVGKRTGVVQVWRVRVQV